MSTPRPYQANPRRREIRNQNSNGRLRIREHAKSRRAIVHRDQQSTFDPPEDWHEPTGSMGYRIIVRRPGTRCRHVVTPDQIRTRLAKLPEQFLKGLEVVQLSQMTRKKNFCPCYGLQWGCAIYLYPFDESMDEYFYRPPPRSLVIESKMFGGRWEQPAPDVWRLIWTEASARDFQLNNILIHELGHLIDNRNTNYTDQERFAEWFAIEYGYRRSGGQDRRRPKQKVRRRHHGV